MSLTAFICLVLIHTSVHYIPSRHANIQPPLHPSCLLRFIGISAKASCRGRDGCPGKRLEESSSPVRDCGTEGWEDGRGSLIEKRATAGTPPSHPSLPAGARPNHSPGRGRDTPRTRAASAGWGCRRTKFSGARRPHDRGIHSVVHCSTPLCPSPISVTANGDGAAEGMTPSPPTSSRARPSSLSLRPDQLLVVPLYTTRMAHDSGQALVYMTETLSPRSSPSQSHAAPYCHGGAPRPSPLNHQ